jgi:uncharacterized protein YbjT (DUF2867 family)
VTGTTSPNRPGLLVAVHGATGAQGRAVIDRLLAAGHRPRAVARNPDPQRLPAAVETAVADAADSDALTEAYAGVDAAVLVLPGGAPDDVAVAQAEAILEALARARVARAVFNAGGAIWTRPPAIPFLQARSRLVAGLPAAVPRSTVVAPVGGLMENFSEPWIVERLRRTGELVQSSLPEASMRPVAMADIATAALDALTGAAPPGRVLVQGPAEHTGSGIAQAIGAHLGRPVQWTAISPDEYLRGVADGLGQQYAANIGALYGGHVRIDPPDAPPPGTAHITGRTSLQAWIPTQSWT